MGIENDPVVGELEDAIVIAARKLRARLTALRGVEPPVALMLEIVRATLEANLVEQKWETREDGVARLRPPGTRPVAEAVNINIRAEHIDVPSLVRVAELRGLTLDDATARVLARGIRDELAEVEASARKAGDGALAGEAPP